MRRELERGFDVHVAVGTEGLRDDFPEQVRLHPLAELRRHVSPSSDRRALRTLAALVRSYDFDIVHTHQSKAGALGRIAALESRAVVLHTVHLASFGPGYGARQSALFVRVERRLAPRTDRLIFVGGDLLRRYLAAGVGRPDRSLIVRSPIANLASLLELRSVRAGPRGPARTAIGAAADTPIVLMVGALDRRKRHALAIRALAPALAARRAQLVIAGDGPERRALERLCDRLGIDEAVTFAGFVAEVEPLYAAADLLVQSSALEGVPQAVVQAIAAGVPVVATEVDGVSEAAPGLPQVRIVPPNGHGLLTAVEATLARPPAPAPVQEVARWLPASVDQRLDLLHDWVEAQVAGRRSPAALRARAPDAPPAVLAGEGRLRR